MAASNRKVARLRTGSPRLMFGPRWETRHSGKSAAPWGMSCPTTSLFDEAHMSRALIILNSTQDRLRAVSWVQKAPAGTRLEFKAAKRSLPQNDLMWSRLTDVANQLTWHGVKLRPDDWKVVFMDALKREVRIVPNIDGNGFVNLGRSSSDLSKEEMSDLIALIESFGAQHGVKFHDPAQAAA